MEGGREYKTLIRLIAPLLLQVRAIITAMRCGVKASSEKEISRKQISSRRQNETIGVRIEQGTRE
jgi:hypothetical protein